jgi:beta-lactamase regulating signal transducer with metallopeptidase domain
VTRVERLLYIGLVNAAMALALALLATATARCCPRRPALVASLWSLVLLKLITPPLWGVKVDGPAWLVAAPSSSVKSEYVSTLPQPAPLSDPPPTVIDFGEMAFADEVPPVSESAASAPEPILLPPPAPPAADQHWAREWKHWLFTGAAYAWALGSFFCLVAITFRIARFVRALRFSELAPPALQRRAEALAHRMALPAAPRVEFVRGGICPLLWAGFGRARLLVPIELWNRLDDGQQASLLAHELAHLTRRDHWVRVLEVLATVAYWWCPLTWWARARLREAEEQCCDAWVVWALPGRARDYAGALLETVEFVVAHAARGRGGSGPSTAVPMLASGMGQFHQLARRLTMIKSERIPRKLSWLGRAAVCALAAAWLPLAPTRAQAPAPVEPAVAPVPPLPPLDPVAPITPQEPAAVAAPIKPSVTISVATPVVERFEAPFEFGGADSPVKIKNDDRDGDDDEKSVIKDLKRGRRTDVPDVKPEARDPKMTQELQRARERVNQLAQQLEAAQIQLKALEARQGGGGGRSVTITTRDGQQRIVEIDNKTGKVIQETVVGKVGANPPAPGTPAVPGGYPAEPFHDFKYRPSTAAPGRTPPAVNYGNKWPADPDASREKRLSQLESNLKALLDEVKALRDEGDRKRDEPRREPVPARK